MSPKPLCPGDRCCVVGCSNNSSNSPGTHFYSFSVKKHKSEQREKWIKAVKRELVHGAPWQPSKRSRICSRHFVGNAKSEHPLSPSFIPTIFPIEHYGANMRSARAISHAQNRFGRAMNRASVAKPEKNKQQKKDEPQYREQGVQTYCADEASAVTGLISNRIGSNKVFQAETQCMITKKKLAEKFDKKKCDPSNMYADASVDPDLLHAARLECQGFHGQQSLKDEQYLLKLAGVNSKTFIILLRICSDMNALKVSKESRLLIYLYKMRLGLTFSAIGVLFALDRTTVSRIFYFTLQHLFQACRNFVQWPSKETI